MSSLSPTVPELSAGSRPSGPPAGVVFDCDGVLVDSEPLHARATTEWAASIGITVPPEAFDDLVGLTVPEQIARILEGTAHHVAHGYIARERHFWRLAVELTPLDGVVELIRRLRAAGTLVAVCSNGSRRYVDHVVTVLGLRPLIEGFICADDVQYAKPHPEPYLRAVRLLGLEAEDCWAIEDSGPGATSARAAGLRVLRLDPTGRAASSASLTVVPGLGEAAAVLLPTAAVATPS